MAPIELYGVDLSAPCRTVAMAAEVAGAEYKIIETSPLDGGTRTPEFLAMNPTHTVPTIKDGDFVLYESRAVASYIMNKYCKDPKMVPQDTETKALVEARLYFDMGCLYKKFGDMVYPLLFAGVKPGEKEIEGLKEMLGIFDKYVAGGFVAGTDCLTVADLSLVATYSSIVATECIDLSEYKNANAWLEKCKGLIPNYEKANGEGAAKFGAFYKSKL